MVKYGLASRCARVRAAEVAVLDLEDPTSDAYAQISLAKAYLGTAPNFIRHQ